MRRLLLPLALLPVVGCQEAPVPRSHPSPDHAVAQPVKQEGDELLGQGQYEAAARNYRAALEQTPSDVALHYALGAAYSHLSRQSDTIEQFRWVVDHGQPGSPEVELARNWLHDAGESSRQPSSLPTSIRPATVAEDTRPRGKVVGTTEWAGHNPNARVVDLRITLTGDEGLNHDVQISRRFRLGEAFGFRSVPTGRYRLIVTADETQLWHQEILVEEGKDTVVSLSNANSPIPPDRLPDSG